MPHATKLLTCCLFVHALVPCIFTQNVRPVDDICSLLNPLHCGPIFTEKGAGASETMHEVSSLHLSSITVTMEPNLYISMSHLHFQIGIQPQRQ
jgi:hypothetical protein